MTARRLATILAALALALAACSGDTSVGAGLDTDLGGTGDGPRLGERTDEPTPEPTGTPTDAPTPTQAPTQPAPEPTQAPPTEPQQQIALEIKIFSDTEGPSQFDPSLARIFVGTCVRWTNVDTVERSVQADDGSFASGPLAPGEEFVHCFDDVGKFNYHDGTRPYAVAAVEVLPR